ncbi:MAG: GNAT family N-acetyltransferase [Deltaproteobacteria bacterium RIFCSPLOWO2_12_FULL_60_19]|nr:MAG: GNAT family N-acetyltransferase [Deltaproteobacteria bacterium RIFCSPLOWO2_12_FULL_60_19]
MAKVHPLYLPPPYQDSAESGRLILRDGTTAAIRPAQPADQAALREFFAGLSPESRRRRFFSAGVPPDKLLESFCNSSDPRARLTLVVTRAQPAGERIIAAATYDARDDKTAEAAIAVADDFQGKGLGTLLLERLALLAVRHGFTRLWAVTGVENRRMMEIFHNSGFGLRETQEGGYVEIDLSAAPTEASVARTELRDRLFTAASLRPFFSPGAVAVVGASRDPSSIGYRILEALVENRFQGPVYPVNPRASAVRSIHAYPSVRELPEAVDLAIVAVPREATAAVVDDCAARGIKALVVITAGFAETGAEGKALQQKLVEKVRGYGMRMVGPNCLGLINTDPQVRLNASFSPLFPPTGCVAMSSQSGALGLAILALAGQRGLGLSTFVSVGNKADVSSNDLLQYWEEDPRTRLILLYLESFGNPRRFARIARRVSRSKPIVAIKAGRTGAGTRAAGSHTAALAASDVAVDALFRQTGVIRAETLDEMFDIAAALGSQPLPRGRRVAIVTNAGGPAIMCADACEAGGLSIPQFSDATRSRLASFLPPAASVGNPVDMIASASPDHFRRAVETVLAAGEIDALIVIFVVVGAAKVEEVARAVSRGVAAARAAGGADKPVLVCMLADAGARAPLALDGETIPAYLFPETAARALCKIAAYAEWRSRPPGTIPEFDDADARAAREVCRKVLQARGAGWLSVEETRAVLEAVRLPLARGGFAASADEAAALARSFGFPVAVKLASRTLVHKSDVGGVMLNLADEAAVRGAFAEIRSRLERDGRLAEMDGVLVQPMIRAGVEVMVGVSADPLFGPLIAFGLGGIYVEILGDVRFRVTPLTDRDAAEMAREIRGYRLLEGYRGHPPADVEAIEEILLRVSRLVEEVPEIGELDLNPIFAQPPGQGCLIADARIRVAG